MRIIQLQVMLRVPEDEDHSPDNMRHFTERALEEGPDPEWADTEILLVMMVSSEREG